MPGLVTNAKSELVGLPELQKKLQNLRNDLAGKEAQQIVAEVAEEGAGKFRAKAAEQRWPHEAIESIFSYGKQRDAKEVSALMGVKKRGRQRPFAPGYVEWGKRVGRIVGESLATMFEFGTSKMGARPAMRPVITEMRRTAPQKIADGLREIIHRHTKR